MNIFDVTDDSSLNAHKKQKLVINLRDGENESDGLMAGREQSLAFDRHSTYLSVSGQAGQESVLPIDLLEDD